jgi:hypothetical protein
MPSLMAITPVRLEVDGGIVIVLFSFCSTTSVIWLSGGSLVRWRSRDHRVQPQQTCLLKRLRDDAAKVEDIL